MGKALILIDNFVQSPEVTGDEIIADLESELKGSKPKHIRDAQGKLIRLELTLPDIDNAGIANAKAKINANKGIVTIATQVCPDPYVIFDLTDLAVTGVSAPSNGAFASIIACLDKDLAVPFNPNNLGAFGHGPGSSVFGEAVGSYTDFNNNSNGNCAAFLALLNSSTSNVVISAGATWLMTPTPVDPITAILQNNLTVNAPSAGNTLNIEAFWIGKDGRLYKVFGLELTATFGFVFTFGPEDFATACQKPAA